jgi:uncharacterized protein YjeT (DUF2065 family)
LAWADLLAGLAFYLIIEGLLPFASPQRWRRSLSVLAGLEDNQLRVFGLGAVIVGLTLLAVVRS